MHQRGGWILAPCGFTSSSCLLKQTGAISLPPVEIARNVARHKLRSFLTISGIVLEADLARRLLCDIEGVRDGKVPADKGPAQFQ